MKKSMTIFVTHFDVYNNNKINLKGLTTTKLKAGQTTTYPFRTIYLGICIFQNVTQTIFSNHIYPAPIQ